MDTSKEKKVLDRFVTDLPISSHGVSQDLKFPVQTLKCALGTGLLSVQKEPGGRHGSFPQAPPLQAPPTCD